MKSAKNIIMEWTNRQETDYGIMHLDTAYAMLKETQMEAIKEAIEIVSKYNKCNCPDYYTKIARHDPNASHLDSEEIKSELETLLKGLS